MKIKLAVIGTAALLAACSASTQKTAVAGLETALAAAESGAYAYASLPRCGVAGSTAACSQQAIVDDMKSKDNTAYAAIKAAESSAAAGASIDLTAATAALSVFQNVVTVNATK